MIYVTSNIKIKKIFIFPDITEYFLDLKSVDVVKGKGLVGDRYFDKKEGLISFIDTTDLDIIKFKLGINFEDNILRRNIITKNINLNNLINKKFLINKTLFIGKYMCGACKHIEERTNIKNLIGVLYKNSGILALPLSNGNIITD
jgi:MOSC domain-containing protein YiiM